MISMPLFAPSSDHAIAVPETNDQSERKANSPTLDRDRDQNVEPDVHGAGHAA